MGGGGIVMSFPQPNGFEQYSATKIFRQLIETDGDGNPVLRTSASVTLSAADIEIGAVEIKNSTDDTRATVGANGLYTELRTAIPAGTNVIGKVSIDQTTPGTTNLVDTELPAAALMADAVVLPTSPAVQAILKGYNGSTTDLVRTGQTSNSTTVTGFTNQLPMARYNASPTARTEAQFGNLQADINGNLLVSSATLISGEDQTNNVLQVIQKATSVSTYTYTRDSATALEASSISKASAGNLYRAFGVIDKSAATGMYYILFLDSATLTADGAVTHLITPIPVNHVNGVDSSFDTGHFDFGVAASNGIVIVLSTTMVTKTIAGSLFFSTVLFK